MNDQTAKKDNGKIAITLAPPEIMEAVAVVKMFGNEKYPEGGNDNWKKVEIERYRNALFRHLFEYLREPYKLDTESNLPSLYHAAWNISTLLWLEMEAGTIPHPEEALKKMHHPEPVRASTSHEMVNDGYLFADDLKTPRNGVKRDCDNCRYFEVRVTDRPCFACDENNSEWKEKDE